MISTEKAESFHFACIDCMKCTKHCSFSIKNDFSPKEATNKIKNHTFNKKSCYDCNQCGYCQEVCPKFLNYGDIFYTLKKELFQNTHQVMNTKATLSISTHQNLTHSSLFNHPLKGFTSEANRKVFFPGCALISANPNTVKKAYQYFQLQNDNIGLMSQCCGKPNLTVGKIDNYTENFEQIKEAINHHHVTEIITACPNCHVILEDEFKHLKITHFSEAMLRYGPPEVHKIETIDVTLHDPCPFRSHPHIHKAVRDLVKTINIPLAERSLEKEKTLCCGSGGMQRVIAPLTANLYTKHFCETFSEAKSTITYCQECVQVLSHEHRPAYHLLTLFFDDHIHLNKPHKDIHFFTKWYNRFKYVTTIKTTFI